jgi:predicted transcriptional regulator
MTNKEVIIGLLKDHPQGLTIEELSSRGKLNRTTVRVILAELISVKEVIQRNVGQAKLNYWNFNKEKEEGKEEI